MSMAKGSRIQKHGHNSIEETRIPAVGASVITDNSGIIKYYIKKISEN